MSTAAPAESLDLVVSCVIDASPDKVFQTWTDPSKFGDWWGPHGMTTPVVEMDLRPGGIFRTLMRDPTGNEYPNSGFFVEVVPPQRLVFTDKLDAGGRPSPEAFMVATHAFEDLGGGRTKYTATAGHFSRDKRDQHEQMGFHKGWGEMLERFAACVASA